MRSMSWLMFVLFGCLAAPGSAAENLVFVTWDGFRWQELFSGAEEPLISKELGGVPEVAGLRTAFWRETPRQRREVLLPFFWQVIAQEGQVFGDPDRQAAAQITNGKKFSYPGYSEMFVGFSDPAIRSNNKIPNPHVNVLEFIHRQPGFANRVAAFATWDVMEFILNRERSQLPIQTGWTPLTDAPLTPGQVQVNEMVRDLPRLWRGNTFDVITHRAALEHLKKHQPRVLYIGLGETDEWAHMKRYDLYLESAQRSDQFLRELWELLQSLPQYKGKTHLILTTDHGRGFDREWTNHGETTRGAEFVWMAALGPEVPPLGVRENVRATQSQIAATLARLVGVDFGKVAPQVAAPLDFKPVAR